MTNQTNSTDEIDCQLLIQTARQYLAAGLKVLPVCGKNPGISQWQLKQFDQAAIRTAFEYYIQEHGEQVELGIGVQMGPSSGIVDFEYDSDAQLAKICELFSGSEFLLDDCPVFSSKKGGHYLFAWDEKLEAIGKGNFNVPCSEGEPLIVRLGAGDKGSQSAFPPSKDKTWLPGRSILEVEAPKIPDDVIAQLLAVTHKPAKAIAHDDADDLVDYSAIADVIRATKNMVDGCDGSRRLFVAACRVVEHGLGDAEAVATLRRYEVDNPFPKEFTDDEILRRVRDAEKETTRGKAIPRTDAGNAIRFAALHGADVRYIHKFGRWYCWNGRFWEPDHSGEIMRRAKQTAQSIHREAAA